MTRRTQGAGSPGRSLGSGRERGRLSPVTDGGRLSCSQIRIGLQGADAGAFAPLSRLLSGHSLRAHGAGAPAAHRHPGRQCSGWRAGHRPGRPLGSKPGPVRLVETSVAMGTCRARALVAAMSSARDGRMGDIVATVNRVVTSSGRGVLFRGWQWRCRAAYLFYSSAKRLERSGVLLGGAVAHLPALWSRCCPPG